jgi:hypothetical protein
VPDFRRGNRVLTALNTVQEVLLVVPAVIEFNFIEVLLVVPAVIEFNFISPYLFLQKRLRLSIYFAACYENPPFASFETCVPSTGCQK